MYSSFPEDNYYFSAFRSVVLFLKIIISLVLSRNFKNELKEIDIKNRTCYYFDYTIRFLDRAIEFRDILLDEKLYKEKYENIFIYDISYKTSTGAKPLRIRFDKIDGFIKVHHEIRCLVFFYCSDKI